MGWVAMWRPISIFLYEWWPIRDALLTYESLGVVDIEVLNPELPLYRRMTERAIAKPLGRVRDLKNQTSPV
jgi:hypothetical protein